jgi:hypothetical protein
MVSVFVAASALSTVIAASPQRALEQTVRSGAVPIEFAGIPSPDAPETPEAWSIQLATRGGFVSTPTSTLTISSVGWVACEAQAGGCRSKLDLAELTTLSELISQALTAFGASPVSFCSDCQQHVLLLKRRDTNGAQQQYAVRWDVTTLGSLSDAVQQLVRSATTLVRTGK